MYAGKTMSMYAGKIIEEFLKIIQWYAWTILFH